MNKVIRLPNGNFITRKFVESDPAALAKAKPEEIWTMNDGKSNSGKTTYKRSILVRDMETSHLINAMASLVKRAKEKMTASGMIAIDEHSHKHAAAHLFPVYKTMCNELQIRLGKKQREKPAEEQPKRCFNFE